MPTLLLRLEGPMQSWGTTSRFDQRDTGKEPSKSAVLGLLCAALGIDRENWVDLEPLTKLIMGVRHDRPGILRRDYQTAGCAEADTIIKADGKPSNDGVVSDRFYLADAAFLVGLEGDNLSLLESAHRAILNPKWVLGLGRKSYLPAEPIYLKDGLFQDKSLKDALISYPWLGRGPAPKSLTFSFESLDGSGRMVMDQLFSSFAERKFRSRFVKTELLSFEKEISNVSS
ncbi:MAG: type I-E CRISPR-associated protein Cas5/CasD [Chitinivibrionales bacterium]